MGFQDALHQMRVPYASDAAMEFADANMEAISYFAILASSRLAELRGRYSSYEGSKWDRGILPLDSIDLLEESRGESTGINKNRPRRTGALSVNQLHVTACAIATVWRLPLRQPSPP